jgi:hypothetical protein
VRAGLDGVQSWQREIAIMSLERVALEAFDDHVRVIFDAIDELRDDLAHEASEGIKLTRGEDEES